MRVNNIQKTPFGGALNNKFVLGALEKISEHSASFTALSAVGASVLLRPLAIKATPKVKSENKEHSVANSLASGLVKLLTTFALSVPIEHAIKTIENNPKNFLNEAGKSFAKDKNAFNFASQTLKFSSNILTAIPKTALTVALIPPIVNKLFKPVNEEKTASKEQIPFKGKLQDGFTKLVSKYFNNNSVQNFAIKNKANSSNVARNMTALTDMVLAGSYIFNTKRNKKLKPERKNNLIYNNVLSTGLSIIAGVGLDKFAQKQSKGLIEKFIQLNKTNPKLDKYIQGINVLRPTIIFAMVYYGLLPIISGYFAQKLSDKNEN